MSLLSLLIDLDVRKPEWLNNIIWFWFWKSWSNYKMILDLIIFFCWILLNYLHYYNYFLKYLQINNETKQLYVNRRCSSIIFDQKKKGFGFRFLYFMVLNLVRVLALAWKKSCMYLYSLLSKMTAMEMNGKQISSSGNVWYSSQTKSYWNHSFIYLFIEKSTSNLEHSLIRFMALIFVLWKTCKTFMKKKNEKKG